MNQKLLKKNDINILINEKIFNKLMKFPDTLEELYISREYIDECKKLNINNRNCKIYSSFN